MALTTEEERSLPVAPGRLAHTRAYNASLRMFEPYNYCLAVGCRTSWPRGAPNDVRDPKGKMTNMYYRVKLLVWSR